MTGSGIKYHTLGVLFAEQQADVAARSNNAALATPLTPASWPYGPTAQVKAVSPLSVNEPISGIPISVQPYWTTGASDEEDS